MAFGSIELTTISRAQDYSGLKQNEDYKGMYDQSNISQQVQKNTDQQLHGVHKSDNADWHQKNPDAKEKGNNAYYGDGGKRRRENRREPRKNEAFCGGFDVKI